ncbi:FkbM family methyltransferase [Methylobacillus flagellatus]|uniref:Methyltransferase FkbM n=1 Tax=Methylobacillus flagellatus (strain ATCC 51484 / DSM 6875 / VKM B-1610 / KT) TaxID=265072 RepID=Q1H3A5_METFK|nr:FkbM family methyltransferase [Methylobacillus flagellatus]ABE49032.1 Methyltransferase FkbM [Methylobacillus flagellatus KT]
MHRSLVKLTTKRGKVLSAFEGDAITQEIQKKGEYDSNILNSLADVLGDIKPETSLDIGANIGNHALVIADYSRHLIAFEPVDFIFQVLKVNVEQNNVKNAEVVNVGLSDVDQEMEIFIPDNANLGSSSLEVMEGDGQRLKVRTLIGDEYLAQRQVNQVDFIKMDVEGHEVPALKGLKHTIQQHQPLLLLEYKNKKTLDEFIEYDLLNNLFSGYTIFSITITNSRKIHGRGVCGFLRRFYYKYFDRRWVLSSFFPEKKYSNIYLVPERYLGIFRKYRFIPSSAQ